MRKLSQPQIAALDTVVHRGAEPMPPMNTLHSLRRKQSTMTYHTQTVRGAETGRLKPLSPYGRMITAVRIPKNQMALARGLQRRGHTLREIALVLDMSVEPVRRSLYEDVVAK